MSTYTNNTQKLYTNTDENNLTSNEQSYDNLINVCALRKQFSRIIPSYYTEIQKQGLKMKRQNISSIEEYKKLQEEIDMIQESIELLKEKKQKKLKEIENLRSLMRKVGNKKMTKEDKKLSIIIAEEKRTRMTLVLDAMKEKAVMDLKYLLMKVFLWPPHYRDYLLERMMISEEKKDYQILNILIVVIILIVIRIVVVVVCVLNMMMIVIEKPPSIILLEVCVCKWRCNNLQHQQHLYQTKYLDIYYELNNGNEETFWFNLIILKGINIIIDYVIKNIFDNDSKFLNLIFLPFLINTF